GPRVLRVYVELAAQERVPEDAGPAELAPVAGLEAGALEELRRHLAQDHRLGELLRADRHRRRLGRHRRRQHRGEGGHAEALLSPPAPRPRCAWTKRVTNGSAGARSSSSSVPSCSTRPPRKRTIRWPKKAASARSWVTR